jgi:O-antigen ligase
LVFSISRTGLISAIAVIILLLAIKFRINLGIVFIKAVPITIFTLGFILTLLIMPENYRNLWFGSISKELIQNSGTTATRIEVWKISIDLFKENPIAGVGVGNFSNLAKERWTLAKKYKGVVVHNSYLSILSQTGLVGLLLYLSWNILLIRRLFKNSRINHKNQILSSSTYTLLFFLFVWGIFGMFTSVEYGKFYWLMSGIAIGLANNSKTFETTAKNTETQKVAGYSLQNL